MIRVACLICAMAGAASADTVVATRTIPPQSVIGPNDVMTRDMSVPGSVADATQIIGKEARVALYAGRPIRPGDVGSPAVVERNQVIPLFYYKHGLFISTEGRALGRAGSGDLIRVMNISSRSTVTARIGPDGAGYVAQ